MYISAKYDENQDALVFMGTEIYPCHEEEK